MAKKTHEQFSNEFYVKHPNYKLISTYTSSRDKVDIVCDKGHLWRVTAGDALRNSCCECYKLFKYNSKTTEQFTQELFDMGINLVVVDEYINAKTKIKFHCPKCDKDFSAMPTNVLKTKGCPMCNTEIGAEKHRISQLTEENKFNNVYPQYANMLVDKSLADKYSYGSRQKTQWICPSCNDILTRSFHQVSQNGLQCSYCGNYNSYPNNFMFNILTQLNIDFISEYSPKWANRKKYDFYFIINNNEYIIEMDGGFHSKNPWGDNLLQNTIDSDNEKNKYAQERNIKLIRIDCNYYNISQRFEYIKYNVLNSELSKILNLDLVDFKQVESYAILPPLKKYIDEWNNGNHNYHAIAQKYKVNYSTVLSNLKRASELGLCDLDYEQQKLINMRKSTDNAILSNSHSCYCPEYDMYFKSITEASKYFHKNISRIMNNKQHTQFTYKDEQLTLNRITKEQYLYYINSKTS